MPKDQPNQRSRETRPLIGPALLADSRWYAACSDTAVIARCRKRGIPTPGRGWWTKIRYREEIPVTGELAGKEDPASPLKKSAPNSKSETSHVASDHQDAQVRFDNDEESGAPGESRTPNLLIRSQTLYPIELRVRVIEQQALAI